MRSGNRIHEDGCYSVRDRGGYPYLSLPLSALPLRDDRWFLLQYLMSFNFRVAVWVG